MKILMHSHWFYPSLGGSEKSAYLLASEFTRCGHEVRVVTQTPGNNLSPDSSEFLFEVIRQPNIVQFFKLIHWCDVYFHNGVSLKAVWPLIFIHKPWIIRHQSWLRETNGTQIGIGGSTSGWKVALKHFVVRFSISTAVSQAIAAHLKYPTAVIATPYQADLFCLVPDVPRDKELIFLGRLVPEKGLDTLLKAIAQLKLQGLKPKLSVVGTGPEEDALRQQTIQLGIDSQVSFLGPKVGHSLVKTLNEHHILVVPTLSNEPSGGVALEGIACGCVVVGSEGGGLKDTIGSCGITFPNGDVNALTDKLAELLRNPNTLSNYRTQASAHLAPYKSTEVAKAYLLVFEEAL